MSILKAIKTYVNFIFFPSKCAICGEKNGEEICQNCQKRLNEIFNPKIVDSVKYDLRCASCFEYKNEIRNLIHKFKFKNQKSVSSILSDFLVLSIQKIFKNEKIDLITFVPVFSNLRDDLKYNQSEILAEKIAKKLKIPVKKCLKKVYNNKKQHKLSFYDRQNNVKGVYSSLENLRNQRVLICDDIITTGATLSECKNELEKSGANVLCATVAYTTLNY